MKAESQFSPEIIDQQRAAFNTWYRKTSQSSDPALRTYAQTAKSFLDDYEARVLYRDPGFGVIGINKPPGMVIYGTEGTRPFGVQELVRIGEKAPNFSVCHRLDRDTSGVVVGATKKGGRRSLAKQFSKSRPRSVRKDYLAVVDGSWSSAVSGILSPLAQSGNLPPPHTQVTVEDTHADMAATKTEKIAQLRDSKGNCLSVLRIRILTGRTHQIRAHVSEIGNNPIVGDSLYNSNPSGATRQQLHAHRLSLRRPGTSPDAEESVTLEAPVPWDMQEIFDGSTVESSSIFFAQLRGR